MGFGVCALGFPNFGCAFLAASGHHGTTNVTRHVMLKAIINAGVGRPRSPSFDS